MLKQFERVLIGVLIVSMVVCLYPATAFASSAADNITYSTDSDDTLDFDAEDFNTACDDLNDTDLDYVKFTALPDDDDGVLYYDYDEDDDDNTEVSTSKKYYYSGTTPKISKITFVPEEDCSGTVTISYKGYDEDGDSYTGKIKISVDESNSSNQIKYTADEDEAIEFDDDDFADVCDDVQDADLDYIKFTLPDEDDGILYYDYDEDDDDNTEVTSSKKYYYEDETPYIKKVTFVPDDDFSGTVTITYTAYDENEETYTGKIKITIGDDDDDDSSTSDKTVSYSIEDNDETVDFDEDDFNDVCNDVQDEDLDYIKITIPSATKGILYYDYSDGNYSSVVSSSKKYYYDGSPYIKDITFVPDDDFTGTCKISFKGYDENGDSFSGVISITIGSASSGAANAISYSGAVNSAIIFKDSDFNNACKSLTDAQLDYIEFTLPSSTYGILYYGYSSTGSYDSKVKASTKYYYSGSPYLLNVSFVPADDITGTITISYTGYSTDGQSYTGTVKITISKTGTTTTTTPTAIDTSTLVSSKYFKDVDISYSWAVPYIDGLYEAGIISGAASGTTKLYSPAANVTRGDFLYLLYKTLNFTTSSTTTGFSDVPSTSYYYTAITMAKALGIAQGSDNKFYPNNPITREDAMVMVLRAVNITGKTISSGDTSNLSTYSDSGSISDYSKSAVAALIKAGIITGSDDNKIYPQGNLTRAQIAAIIYRVKNL